MEVQEKINKDFTNKRQNGVYSTPEKTAKFMVSLVTKYITSDSLILDPCVGEGIFIKYLLKSGVDSKNIYSYDINKDVVNEIKHKYSINAYTKDFLLNTSQLFNIIIGNPPYKSRRNNEYFKNNKLELEEKFNDIGLYNMYSLFTVEAINRLEPDGIVCFIVEDAFMTNRYYKRFRKFILDTCFIEDLILAPRKLFHGVKADVNTVILVLRKKSNLINSEIIFEQERSHTIGMIGRCLSEDEYTNPNRKQEIKQITFRKMPDYKFFIDIPLKLISIITNAETSFGDICTGGAGISTGNDKKYLRSRKEVIDNKNWVGFYKSGQRTPYYYETEYFIEKDFKKYSTSDNNFIVRNEQFFFKRGITCSSVGRKFTAALLPEGNLFGVNANFFFKSENDLLYNLGFLNSKLVIFICRKFLARSNIIATSFIREIPYILPTEKEKVRVIEQVQKIIMKLKLDKSSTIEVEQSIIDETIFNLYQINLDLQQEILDFYKHILDRV